MDKEEIKKILPHRENMLLVDEAIIDSDGNSKGYYTVKGDEFFLKGHFPNNPVVPGVMLCEMMAQSSCILLAEKACGKTPYFTGLNNVKFRSMVKIGNKIEFICSLTKEKSPFYFVSGKGFVDGKLCVSGDFSFALI